MNQLTININSKTMCRLSWVTIIVISIATLFSLLLIDQLIVWIFIYFILLVIALSLLEFLMMMSDSYIENAFMNLFFLFVGTSLALLIVIVIQVNQSQSSIITGDIEDESSLISAIGVISFLNILVIYILSALLPIKKIIRKRIGYDIKGQINDGIVIFKIPDSIETKYDDEILHEEITKLIIDANPFSAKDRQYLGKINEYSLLRIGHTRILYKISNKYTSILLMPLDGRTINFEEAIHYARKIDFGLSQSLHFEIPTNDAFNLNKIGILEAYGKYLTPEKKPLIAKESHKTAFIRYRRIIGFIALIASLATFLLIPNPISDIILSDRITTVIIILSIVGAALWALIRPSRTNI